MNLLDIAAKLTLDTSQYDKAVDGSKSTASKIGTGLKTAAGVGVAAVGAIAGAVAGTATQISNVANETAAYGDVVDKQSQKLGMSKQAYQEWDYVMNLAGTSMGDMSTGMKTLTNQIDNAKNGSEDAQARFEALGISMDELNQMSREDAFEAVVAGMQSMEDSTERAALANDLFGKSGQNLTPLFNMTAEETQQAIDLANEYGMVMSDDAVSASAKYEDALTTMQNTMSGLKNNMVAEFLPGMTDVMNGIAAFVSGDEGGLAQMNDGIGSFVDTAVEQLPKFLEMGVQMVESIAMGIVDNLPELITTALDLVKTLADDIIQNLPELISAAQEVIVTIVQGIGEYLPELIPAAIDAILTIVETLTAPGQLTQILGAALQLMIGLAEGMIKALPRLLQSIPKIISNIITTLITFIPQIAVAGVQLLLERLIANMPQIVLGIVNALPQIVAEIVNTFKDPQFQRQMAEAGMQLLNGLKQGIMNFVPNLIASCAQAMQGVINTVKRTFGIHSPSKVFAGIGEYLTEGLAIGISDTAETAVKSAEQMSQDVIDAMSLGTDVNGTFETDINNPSNIVLQIYGAAGQDVNELADIISERMADAYGRGKAVYA